MNTSETTPDMQETKQRKKRIGFYARLTPTLDRKLKAVIRGKGKRGPQEYVRDLINQDYDLLIASRKKAT